MQTAILEARMRARASADTAREDWIICQIGARENYAVARAMARHGALAALITDAWVPHDSLLARVPGRLSERRHAELAGARVEAPTLATIAQEASERLVGRGGWPQIMTRNARFQKMAARHVKRIAAERRGRRCTVFAYSYAARDILSAAKAMGWPAILGQIDPGPVEARLVTDLYRDAGQEDVHAPIPDDYWRMWREETRLADAIVVNSAWSREALAAEGVPSAKIRVVPLAYEGEAMSAQAAPRIPPRFTPERALRMLFLGQVTLRKGIGALFEAMRLIPDAPVVLDVVGPLQVSLPDAVRSDPRIVIHGAVPRSAVHDHYRRADLFMFPTLSDGFGLTQLEALAAGVPVIASRRCGEVVIHDCNGALLDEVDGASIAGLLTAILAEPGHLARWRREARLDGRFGVDAVGQALLSVTGTL